MIASLVDIASWALLLGGGVFCMVGALGMLRLPDFYTRMHAASILETLGAGLLIAGMMLQAGATLVSVKLAFLALLLFFASPTASHALARAARLRGVEPVLAEQGEPPSRS